MCFATTSAVHGNVEDGEPGAGQADRVIWDITLHKCNWVNTEKAVLANDGISKLHLLNLLVGVDSFRRHVSKHMIALNTCSG